MPKLNVTLLLDRAGLVGEDGATHHGVWDLASMLPVPNMVILAPRDLNELRTMMRWDASGTNPPCASAMGVNPSICRRATRRRISRSASVNGS